MSLSNYQLSPSLLACNFFNLEAEMAHLKQHGVSMVHFDVMDQHYVPNLTFGPVICQAIKSHCPDLVMDVHLMVQPADALIESFAKAGADIITIHPESTIHLDRALKRIRELGCKAGLAFNPATPLDVLSTTIHLLDLILIMSVNPGFGGQTFIPSVLPKIAEARSAITASGQSIMLEVDGGIHESNIQEVAQAGADTFVIGSALFQHPRYPEVIPDYWTLLNSK